MKGFCMGEKVLWKYPTKGPRANPDGNTGSQWGEAIFLGYARFANTYMVGTDNGVVYPRSLERVPEPERWNRDVVAALKSTPENTKEKKDAHVTFEQEAPVVMIPAQERPPLPTRMRIFQADLNKFGYTAGCKQCTHMREQGGAKNGLVHDDRCRARIMAEHAKSPEGQARLAKHEDAVNEALAKRLEADVAHPPPAESLAPGAVPQAVPTPISTTPTRTLGDERQYLIPPFGVDADDVLQQPALPSAASAHGAREPEGARGMGSSPMEEEGDMNVDFVQAIDDETYVCAACDWRGRCTLNGHCRNQVCHVSGCLTPMARSCSTSRPDTDQHYTDKNPGR